MTQQIDYTIANAKYAGRWGDPAKRSKAIRCPSPDNYKTRAARLVEALKGRYSGRERAYIISPTKAARFERLFAEGWDASIFGELIAPKAAE